MRIATALLALGLCSACASTGASTPADPSSTVTLMSPCRLGGDGFALSIAAGVRGASSPIAAAAEFVQHNDSFGTPASTWRQLSVDDMGVRVTDGHNQLHVSRMSDASWVVDSGGHCR